MYHAQGNRWLIEERLTASLQLRLSFRIHYRLLTMIHLQLCISCFQETRGLPRPFEVFWSSHLENYQSYSGKQTHWKRVRREANKLLSSFFRYFREKVTKPWLLVFVFHFSLFLLLGFACHFLSVAKHLEEPSKTVNYSCARAWFKQQQVIFLRAY